jgi:hypothetical protein
MTATILGFLSFLLLAGSGFFWSRGMRNVSIPENRSGFVAAWLGAATLGIAAHSIGVGLLGGIPATLGVAGGLFLVLLIGISRQKVAVDAIAVGGSLPHFTARDEEDQIFDSSSLRGQPVLIKFFRGHW